MAYWDTSCLAKLYVPESDSDVFHDFAARGDVIRTSTLSRLEFFVLVHRKEAEGYLRPGGARKAVAQYDEDIESNQIVVVPPNARVLAPLRGDCTSVFLPEAIPAASYPRRPPLGHRQGDRGDGDCDHGQTNEGSGLRPWIQTNAGGGFGATRRTIMTIEEEAYCHANKKRG